MTTKLEAQHARVRYFLDLRKLEQPAQNARNEMYRDMLQFCLWQVGIASAGIAGLVAATDRILAIKAGALGIWYVAALGAYVFTIIRTTWTYSQFLRHGLGRFAEHTRSYIESRALLIPAGLDGSLSVEQLGLLEKLRQREELDNEQRSRDEQELMQRVTVQSLSLHAGLLATLAIVVYVPYSALIDAAFTFVAKLIS